jgi:hypothetical protein
MKPAIALSTALLLSLLALSAPGQAQTATPAARQPAKPETSATRSRPPATDGLGTRLPAGLDRAALVALFKLPPAYANLVSLVGARPWSQRPNSYVVIVCLMQNGQRRPGLQECRPSEPDKVPPGIHVGVVEMLPGSPPRLVAGSGLIEHLTSWNETALPAIPSIAKKDSHLRAAPQTWDRFDLAPYRIRPDSVAFGLRAVWNETYGWGFGEFEALYLFEIDGEHLRLVFAEPMSVRQVLVGEALQEEPRDMGQVEDSNVLVLSKLATEGYFNLQMKSKESGQVRHFTWSPQDRMYGAPMMRGLPN